MLSSDVDRSHKVILSGHMTHLKFLILTNSLIHSIGVALSFFMVRSTAPILSTYTTIYS